MHERCEPHLIAGNLCGHVNGMLAACMILFHTVSTNRSALLNTTANQYMHITSASQFVCIYAAHCACITCHLFTADYDRSFSHTLLSFSVSLALARYPPRSARFAVLGLRWLHDSK